MNPLFLLLGIFGAGLASARSSSSNSTSVSDDLATIPLEQSKADDEDVQEPVADEIVNEPEQPETPQQSEEPEQSEQPEVTQQAGQLEQPEQPTTPEQPEAPQQSGDGGSGADTAPTILNSGTVDVIAGRVATLQPSSDITDVRIVSGVEHGKVTVNPDNTFALVMTQSDFTGSQSFTYEATNTDGSVSTHQIDLNVTPGSAELGWATGEAHYMLATDENDDIVVEHGENHQSVYVSGSNTALSLANIAAIEGVSVANITGSWLADSRYGATQDTALDLDAGMTLWRELMPRDAEDSSNWLLFERGYSYDDYGSLFEQGVDGESALHPIYIGAWGDGDRPVLQDPLNMVGHSSKNVVIQGLHFTDGVTLLEAENIILDDVTLTEDSLVIQEGAGITIRNSNFYDIYRTHDEGNIINGEWATSGNNTQGAFIKTIDGLRIEGNFFDMNGWHADYDLDGSASGEQPPLMFNHNLYVQRDNMDVSFIDNITMRASLNGAQIRPGGFIENNVYIDNNAAGNFGYYYYTLFTDNLVTSGASKVAPDIGLSASGMNGEAAVMASLVDNVIAHLADPNSDEAEWKGADYALRTTDPFYDDTIIWNWDTDTEVGQANQNTEGLDTNVLNETTIQEFAAQLLGDSNATIADLAEYLRDQSNGLFDDVVDSDVIIRFFQEGFGLAPDIRTEAATLRFIPDELGEGLRWDNALNWDTEDRPGELFQNDSVDLGGNTVLYGSNTTVNTIDFGPDGVLNIHGGRLDATGGLIGEDDSTLDVYGVGQIWTDGSDANDLMIRVSEDGRFVNTGEMSGAELTASGGQTVLATGGAEYDLTAGDTLSVIGDAAIGFDDDTGGVAILDMHDESILAFSAEDGALGTIAEFRTGAFGDTPDVKSGIDLGNAELQIDLAGLSAANGTQFTLMSADEIVGLFDEAVVGGLGSRNATIMIDYENDNVTLQLSSGSGNVSVETVGEQTDIAPDSEDIWSALTIGQGLVSETNAMVMEDDEDALLVA